MGFEATSNRPPLRPRTVWPAFFLPQGGAGGSQGPPLGFWVALRRPLGPAKGLFGETGGAPGPPGPPSGLPKGPNAFFLGPPEGPICSKSTYFPWILMKKKSPMGSPRDGVQAPEAHRGRRCEPEGSGRRPRRAPGGPEGPPRGEVFSPGGPGGAQGALQESQGGHRAPKGAPGGRISGRVRASPNESRRNARGRRQA